VKVLVVTGGHPFEEKAFFDMFRDADGVIAHAALGARPRSSSSRAGKNYDALVFYEMNQNCSGGAQVVLGPQTVPESANCCPR
jgi:hypothetical protein